MQTSEDEIRVLTPTGVTGSGFLERSYEQGLAQKPHFIGAAAGSTDPGPEFLGSGATVFPTAVIKRDLRSMMLGARRIKVPLLICTAGTGGNNTPLENLAVLAELARLICGRNAGPFELTFDIMFEDDAAYQRVKNSGALTRDMVAQRYHLPASDVIFFSCDHAYAIKASIPRPYFQGDPRDNAGHGGQQYAPPMDIEIK